MGITATNLPRTTALIAATVAIGFGSALAKPPALASVEVVGEAAMQIPSEEGGKAVQRQRPMPVVVPGQTLAIVVKFKDDARVKDIIDAFWKNASDAKVRFKAFKRRRSDLADLELDRVTYSNELVLVRRDKSNLSNELTAMRAIAAHLSAAPDVAYAEVDETAQIGVQ